MTFAEKDLGAVVSAHETMAPTRAGPHLKHRPSTFVLFWVFVLFCLLATFFYVTRFSAPAVPGSSTSELTSTFSPAPASSTTAALSPPQSPSSPPAAGGPVTWTYDELLAPPAPASESDPQVLTTETPTSTPPPVEPASGGGYAILSGISTLPAVITWNVDGSVTSTERAALESARQRIMSITGVVINYGSASEAETRIVSSESSPCSSFPTWAGCTGTSAYASGLVAGATIWLRASMSVSLQRSVVFHEVGHSVGLAHYDSFFNGSWQSMRSFTDGSINDYMSGDVNGLYALAAAYRSPNPPTPPNVGNPGPAPGDEGTFLVSRQTGCVYRVAGGAPVYVSTWSAFAPGQTVTPVDQFVLDSMRQQPADGTILIGAQRGEWYIMVGGAPVYTSTASFLSGRPTMVVDQAAIDNAGGPGPWGHLRARPADGTWVIGAQRGEWYIFAGGAPIYTSTPRPVSANGANRSPIWVDQAALDNADGPGPWSHVSNRPSNGTVLVSLQKGEVFVTAGGAPVYTSTASIIPSDRAWVRIDQAALVNAGASGAWSHLRARPADGTMLLGHARGEWYIVAGGAPLYVSTPQASSGQPLVLVDQAALDNAGASGPWGHLNASPADGTVLLGHSTGEWYIVAGGAPIYTSTPDPAAGHPMVWVDQAAIDNAGGSITWSHLRAQPADGTLLIGAQRGEWYLVAGGAPVYVSTFAAAAGAPPPVWVDQVALDNAGASRTWGHLLFHPAPDTRFVTVPPSSIFQVDASGAPRISSGTKPKTRVDRAAVDFAGYGLPWAHLASPSTP